MPLPEIGSGARIRGHLFSCVRTAPNGGFPCGDRCSDSRWWRRPWPARRRPRSRRSPPPSLGISLPKPGPEHEILKKEASVWDATVEMRMEPGGKPEVTKGVETNTLIGGGLWRVQ